MQMMWRLSFRDGTVSTMPVTISMLVLKRASIRLNLKLRIVSCKALGVMSKLWSVVLFVESCIFFSIVQSSYRATGGRAFFMVFTHVLVSVHMIYCTNIALQNDDWFSVSVWQKRFVAYRKITYLHIGEFDVSWRQYYLQNAFVTQTRRKWLILMSHFAQVITTSNNAHRYFETFFHLT